MPLSAFPIAHGADGYTHHAGEIALTAIAIAAMVIPLLILAFVGRAFWRSSHRDEG